MIGAGYDRLLNHLARQTLRQAGTLAASDIHLRAIDRRNNAVALAVATGDRIRFGANLKTLGIRNGTRGTIIAIDGQHDAADPIVRVELEDGRIVSERWSDYAPPQRGNSVRPLPRITEVIVIRKDTSTFRDVTLFGIVGAVVAIPTLLLGFLVAEVAVHGWNVDAWPPEAVPPGVWIDRILTFQILDVIREFALMILGDHPAFPGGGFWPAVILFGSWLAVTLALTLPRKDPSCRDRRDAAGLRDRLCAGQTGASAHRRRGYRRESHAFCPQRVDRAQILPQHRGCAV